LHHSNYVYVNAGRHQDETIRTIDESPGKIFLQSIVFELVFPMVQISKLYSLPHNPMQGDENSRQKAKIWFFSISWGHCVTSMHDKASLITYLCTQGGL